MNKNLKQIINNHIRKILRELDTNCIDNGQSYYLRYEFFELMYALDRKHIEYNQDEMFKLLDKLNYKVVKAYKCTDYIGV